MASEAERLIALLGLQPHPEGGWFRETFRDAEMIDGRARSTAIHFLLAAGQSSWWHRVDAVEIWHWHRGGPVEIMVAVGDGPAERHVLGPDIEAGQTPQVIIPAHAWQSARPLGEFALVGCTVAPGFEFSKFQMAPPGWAPGR